MRDIKFRGKSKLTGKWLYGYYYNLQTHKNNNELRHIIVYENYGPGNQTEYEPVFEESIGQYTGVKDTNGKEIYEGDIVRIQSVKVNEDDYVIGKVTYSEFEGMYLTNKGYILGRINHRAEVIGNIYENKELLD